LKQKKKNQEAKDKDKDKDKDNDANPFKHLLIAKDILINFDVP
jgi:hypothetical protein